MLFKRVLDAPQAPDYFLVVVRPENIGRLDVGAVAWKSDDALLISFSECRDQQEAMLLMPAYAWLQHALELNDIHLALKDSGNLLTWTAETEIRSRNGLTSTRLGKNYDALVRVRVGEAECRFGPVRHPGCGLGPEADGEHIAVVVSSASDRWSSTDYRQLTTDNQMTLDRFLYLVPNYDVMAFVSKYFWDAKHQVCFGPVKDFLDRVLETQVTVCGRALSGPLNQLLASSRRS